VYLTKEQLVRLVGISGDALVGIQIHTDARDDTIATCEFVDIDINDLRHFTIQSDGRLTETT